LIGYQSLNFSSQFTHLSNLSFISLTYIAKEGPLRIHHTCLIWNLIYSQTKLTTRIICFHLGSVIFQIGNLYVVHLCISKFELHLPFLIFLLSDKVYISFERNMSCNFENTKTKGGFSMFHLTPTPSKVYSSLSGVNKNMKII
jgi:hypothetical protein